MKDDGETRPPLEESLRRLRDDDHTHILEMVRRLDPPLTAARTDVRLRSAWRALALLVHHHFRREEQVVFPELAEPVSCGAAPQLERQLLLVQHEHRLLAQFARQLREAALGDARQERIDALVTRLLDHLEAEDAELFVPLMGRET